MRKHQKKGVSPLIATVLLIAFAVALGAVVMNWGRSYTEQTAENVKKKSDVDVKCSLDVKLKLLELSSKPQMCMSENGASSNITFTVLNDGQKKVEGLRITIFGTSNIATNTSLSNATVPVAGGTRQSVWYNFNEVGNVQKVLIVPIVDISGVQTPCSGSGSVLEQERADILLCNAT